MVKKFVLICLVGLLGIAVFARPVWGRTASSTPVWIAQMETPDRPAPSEQSPANKPAKTSPATKPAPVPQKTTDSPSVEKTADSKPFNPYDMKALKQFDAGDHRAQ
ncbi:MAG: hypothetical protein ACFB2W_27515 [Leptolyngbyaceae cyanobacterium]